MNSTESAGRAYIADISLFLCTLVWGLSFTIMKDILGIGVSVIFFIFIRFAVSSVIILPLSRKRILGLGRHGLLAGFFLGLLLFAGFTTQTSGLLYTTASKSAFITGLSSVLIPFFLLFHRKKLPEPVVIMALIFAAFGLYLLTGRAGGGFNFGDFLTLICAAAFAAQIYFMGLVTKKYDTLALTLIELLTMTLLTGALLPFEKIILIPSAKVIGALVFMTFFATALTLSVQTWAQKRTSAVRAGLIFCAEPVYAYMFAFFLLGERFNSIQLTGAGIIITAIAISEIVPVLRSRRLRPNARI
jgi:drug/metabolite transporter (DMT)-like permease